MSPIQISQERAGEVHLQSSRTIEAKEIPDEFRAADMSLKRRPNLCNNIST
jgi:hypothetical protein